MVKRACKSASRNINDFPFFLPIRKNKYLKNVKEMKVIYNPKKDYANDMTIDISIVEWYGHINVITIVFYPLVSPVFICC